MILINLGTEAPNHSFRFLALSLCLHENKNAYEFTLKTLKSFLLDKCGFEYNPKFAMSDAHLGGMAALSLVFPEITKLRCRFHLDQNIERKLRNLKLKAHISYVRWAINSLSNTKSKEEFLSLWILLEPEIKKITQSDSFVKYLKDEIIDSESIWYSGGSFVGKQKCNNSLEGINRYLKLNWTNEESKSVPEFFIVMQKAMDYYVTKCAEEKCMPTDCRNLKKYFENAQNLITNNQIYKYDNETFVFIRVPKRFKNTKISRKSEMESRIQKVEERIKFCRDNFQNRYESIIIYTKIFDFFRFYDVVKKECSCQTFLNRGICKHNLAVEIKLGRIKNPYQERIAEGSRVGRPRNMQG